MGPVLHRQLDWFNEDKIGLHLLEYLRSIKPYSENVSEKLTVSSIPPIAGFTFVLTKNSKTSRIAVETNKRKITIFQLRNNALSKYATIETLPCIREFLAFSENGDYLMIFMSRQGKLSKLISLDIQIYDIRFPNSITSISLNHSDKIITCVSWVQNDIVYVQHDENNVEILFSKIESNNFLNTQALCSHAEYSRQWGLNFYKIVDIVGIFDNKTLVIFLLTESEEKYDCNNMLYKITFTYCETTKTFSLSNYIRYYFNTIILCLQTDHKDLYIQTPYILYSQCNSEPSFSTIKPRNRVTTQQWLSYKDKKIFCIEPFNFTVVNYLIIPSPFLETFYFNRNYQCNYMFKIKNYRLDHLLKCKSELDLDNGNIIHRVYNNNKELPGQVSIIMANLRKSLHKTFQFNCHLVSCLYVNNAFVLSTGVNLYVYNTL